MLKRKYLPSFLIIILVLLIVFGYFQSKIDSKNIVKYKKFTVARIDSDWHSKEGFTKNFGRDFSYQVKGKIFTKQTNLEVSKEQYFLLLYDSINPRNCVLLTEYPLYNSIKSPKNGWKFSQVPIPIDSIQIKEYVEKYK